MCVLRASGADFDPDAFLSSSSLEAFKILRRGEPHLPRTQPDGPKYAYSGITVVVSNAPMNDLPSQVADAEDFLRLHRAEIEQLAKTPQITELALDFPIELRMGLPGVAAQFDRFPASLVRLAGELGLGLELSIYPRSESVEPAPAAQAAKPVRSAKRRTRTPKRRR
jgi:hypothetical protein